MNIICIRSLAIFAVQIYSDICLVNMWHPNIFRYLFGTECCIRIYSYICLCQCVATIQIFKYTEIFIDKYIHLPKYLLIFFKQIYLNIHLILFSPHEYIRTFIRTVRFQQICLIVLDQLNNSCYATNGMHFDLFL